MATIRKRPAGSWQVSIRAKGRKPLHKTFKTKAAAERWARETETEVERGSFVSAQSAESTLFSELTERYTTEVLPTKKSQRQVLSQLKIINTELGNYSVAALTPQVLANFLDISVSLKFLGIQLVKTYLLLAASCLMHKRNGKYTYPVATLSGRLRFQRNLKGEIVV